MENRSVYLRILNRLNRPQGLLEDAHLHSFVSEALHLSVVEHDLYFKLNSNYMASWAALTAHPGINIKTSIGAFNKLCKEVRNTIPFTRYDKVTKELDADLQCAIDTYKQMEKAKET